MKRWDFAFETTVASSRRDHLLEVWVLADAGEPVEVVRVRMLRERPGIFAGTSESLQYRDLDTERLSADLTERLSDEARIETARWIEDQWAEARQ